MAQRCQCRVSERWLHSKPARAKHTARPLPEQLTTQERATIEAALAETRGRVSGPAGAAAKLRLPRRRSNRGFRLWASTKVVSRRSTGCSQDRHAHLKAPPLKCPTVPLVCCPLEQRRPAGAGSRDLAKLFDFSFAILIKHQCFQQFSVGTCIAQYVADARECVRRR